MIGAGLVKAAWGVEAAGRSLEDIAAPLSLASWRPGLSTEGMGIWSPYPESSSSTGAQATRRTRAA